MNRLKKYSKYIMWAIFAMFYLILNYSYSYETTDLLEQAFQTSMEYDYVMEVWWKTKSDVWKEFLRWWTAIEKGDSAFRDSCFDPETDEIIYIYENWEKLEINDPNLCAIAWWEWTDEWVESNYEPPLIVRITKFLLRVTMVLAITMVLYNAVKYMIEVMWWKDWKSAESKKNLINIAIWIIVALMSVTIINLLVSVPKSSIKTSNDYGYNMDINKLI